MMTRYRHVIEEDAARRIAPYSDLRRVKDEGGARLRTLEDGQRGVLGTNAAHEVGNGGVSRGHAKDGRGIGCRSLRAHVVRVLILHR